MNPLTTFSVFGAGSWGTALAVLLARKQLRVCLWGRDSDQVEAMRQERVNHRYLPQAPFPDSLTISNDLREAAAFGEIAILAVPASAMSGLVEGLVSGSLNAPILVSAAKGLDRDTGETMTQVVGRKITDLSSSVAAVSGPNLAVEIARQAPTATVIASADRETARIVQQAFLTPFFRVYTNPDVIGVELGGALKNIIAIAAGIGDGMGFGDNTKATLMTRGLAEITRLGAALGAQPRTFLGLSGVGDLIATCASPLSRNRTVGFALGQGQTLDEALEAAGQVAEGVPTTRAAYYLAQKTGTEMPITQTLYRILFEGKPPREAVSELMSREAREEEW